MFILDFCSKDSFKTLTYEFLDLNQKRTRFFWHSYILYSTQPRCFYGLVKDHLFNCETRCCKLLSCLLHQKARRKKKTTKQQQNLSCAHPSNLPFLILLTKYGVCTARSHHVAKEELQ